MPCVRRPVMARPCKWQEAGEDGEAGPEGGAKRFSLLPLFRSLLALSEFTIPVVVGSLCIFSFSLTPIWQSTMFLVQCTRNTAAGGQSTIGWFCLFCRAVFHFMTRVFGLMNAVPHCALSSRAWKNAGGKFAGLAGATPRLLFITIFCFCGIS